MTEAERTECPRKEEVVKWTEQPNKMRTGKYPWDLATGMDMIRHLTGVVESFENDVLGYIDLLVFTKIKNSSE